MGQISCRKRWCVGLAVLASIELEEAKRKESFYDEAYLHSKLRELANERSNCPISIDLWLDNPPRNFEKGIRSLERAADQGLATAQATLGMIYFTGIGTPRDPQEAIRWCLWLPVVLPLGMFYLGMAYSAGDGLRRNDDFSIRWIGSAAERGLIMAQLLLGKLAWRRRRETWILSSVTAASCE